MSFYSGLVALMLCLMAGPCHAQTSSAKTPMPTPTATGGRISEAADVAWLNDMQAQVRKASVHGQPWPGPQSGPPARAGVTVAVLSEDLRNGGILGVVKGISEATKVIGWNIKIINLGGTSTDRSAGFAAVAGLKPQGVIFVGIDAKEAHAELQALANRKIPMVGWHVGPQAGIPASGPVAMNVSTDPLEVARVTAMAAVVGSRGKAGVVIFTDSRFEIAKAKAEAMASVIRACKGCTLLEIKDVAISRSAELMPAATRELLSRYGKRWTHALAINDIYFDYAAIELTKAGLPSNAVDMTSAGDGSAAAFLRIQAGTFQTGTVAEPLNLHGWQLVDELNRLLAQRPVSGFLFPVHLVSTANIAFDGGSLLQYDPDNAYRDVYRRIWQR